MPQIVLELLQNSLDAEATVVEIGLDTREWTCWVKDNGHGLDKKDLEVIGQEGDSGRYSTSKPYAPNLTNAESTFGFRGEGEFKILRSGFWPYIPLEWCSIGICRSAFVPGNLISNGEIKRELVTHRQGAFSVLPRKPNYET
jgi:hypothetical protein